MPIPAAKPEPYVTLKQVAQSAGVSLPTASYVLNDTRPTTPEVAQRVRFAAKTLGYRPNQAARALKTGSTRAIGFVVPDLQNPFFPRSCKPPNTALENSVIA